MKKLTQIIGIAVMLSLSAGALTGCGKSDKRSAAVVGVTGPGGFPVGPGGAGTGTYLASAVGNDDPFSSSVVVGGGSNATVQLEMDFFGSATWNQFYNGQVSASGTLRIISYPYGCPALSMYPPGTTLVLQTQYPGQMTGTTFSGLQLVGTSGSYPISVQMQGRLAPAIPQIPGIDGRSYPYKLDADISISGCYMISVN